LDNLDFKYNPFLLTSGTIQPFLTCP